MNLNYLESLPEVKNKYGVNLDQGEKVIFTAKTHGFTNDSYTICLGVDVKFTMTNKNLIFNNGAGIWTANIPDDVVSFTKVAGDGKDVSFLKRKPDHFLVMLNEEVVFNNGRGKLQGFIFNLRKKDEPRLEEIVNGLNGFSA
jgi:hypothetical protein